MFQYVKKEPALKAIERTILTMTEWGKEHNTDLQNYFKQVTTPLAVYHIKAGKISPWLILNCKSGKEMMRKFNDEQLQIIYPVMDPSHWALRFKRLPADVEMVKKVIKEAGL